MIVALMFYGLLFAAIMGVAYYIYTRHFKHLFHEEERYNQRQDSAEDVLDNMNDEMITKIKDALSNQSEKE